MSLGRVKAIVLRTSCEKLAKLQILSNCQNKRKMLQELHFKKSFKEANLGFFQMKLALKKEMGEFEEISCFQIQMAILRVKHCNRWGLCKYSPAGLKAREIQN